MKAPAEIERLVENFNTHIEAYKSGSYNETQVRVEYVNPLFTALGWDVDNKSGYAPSYQDVRHEYRLKTADGAKAPDYCFCIGGTKKFFLETKKPSVYIKDDIGPAFQIRRYGWTDKLSLSILTDFEEFAVYDCHIKPHHNDKASVARIEYFKYTDYLKKWDYIQGIFSKDAIQKGSFDSYIASDSRKKGTMTVDQSFLADMENWRDLLARNIALRNKDLDTKELNHLVQATIDRIVFLRICEDREIEEYGRLQRLFKHDDIYQGLCKFFKQADDKYNSGLFHFQDEKGRGQVDRLSLKLKVDDKPLNEIICKLYYPENPYVFSQIPAEILGQVYEKFLGKVIRLTPSHQAKVEEKPEVRKAGGVYYTPKYIVDYIVKNTVGELLKNKTPTQAKKLCILDPACGSGSFLIGAYQYLLDWYLTAYTKEASKHKKQLYKDKNDQWKLVTQEKKDILLKNIYGVDIDRQAVEVTKLSLLLKVLEGENKDTLQSQMQLFHERALPDLSNNIKCGNSLIGTDFFVGKNLELFDRDDMEKVNAFDWDSKEGFAEIMKAGGFDAVIGNPPYVTYSLGRGRTKTDNIDLEYIKNTWSNSCDYKINSFAVFYELATQLSKKDSISAYIVPGTILVNDSLNKIRSFLLKAGFLTKYHRLDYKVFESAEMGDCAILFIEKRKLTNKHILSLYTQNFQVINRPETHNININSILSQENFRFLKKESNYKLLAKKEGMTRLSEIAKFYNGIKTGNNKRFLAEKKINNTYLPIVRGKDFNRYSGIDQKFFIWFDKEKLWSNYNDNILSVCPKILIRQTGDKIIATLDEFGIYPMDTIHMIYDSDLHLKVLLGIINSKVFNTFHKVLVPETGKAFAEVKISNLKQIYLPNNIREKRRLISLVDQMLDTQKKLHVAKSEQEKKHYQQRADILDRQIDALVYELYGLTPEEIKIVEGES